MACGGVVVGAGWLAWAPDGVLRPLRAADSLSGASRR